MNDAASETPTLAYVVMQITENYGSYPECICPVAVFLDKQQADEFALQLNHQEIAYAYLNPQDMTISKWQCEHEDHDGNYYDVEDVLLNPP